MGRRRPAKREPKLTPQELAIVNEISQLSFATLLDVQGQAFINAGAQQYRQLTGGPVVPFDFQQAAIDLVASEISGIVSLEFATGSGKTYLAAWSSLRFLKNGSTIFVCPNPMAFGDLRSGGIIQKFHRIFEQEAPGKYRLGRLNEASVTNDVLFFTPWRLAYLKRTSPKLFDAIMEWAHLLVLDEAHHYTKGRRHQKIYGQLDDIADNRFLKKGKKLLTLTATHHRLDGLPIVGRDPMMKFTVQDSINAGTCPPIHGIQMFLDIDCPSARLVGDTFDLHLAQREYERYWMSVAGCMIETYRRFPERLAAFVRLKQEAHALVRIFNRGSGLGKHGLVALTHDTSKKERLEIIDGIRKGRLLGYVTCGVGEESLDIPEIAIIHWIKRTRSQVKMMQGVGRGLRPAAGKRRALVVDYQVAKKKIVEACMGLFEYAKAAGVPHEAAAKLVNGGVLLSADGAQTPIMPNAWTLGQCREWVSKRAIDSELNRGDLSRAKALLFWMAKMGAKKPHWSEEKTFQKVSYRKLSHWFERLSWPKDRWYSPQWVSDLMALPRLHESWKEPRRLTLDEREATLRVMAQEGKPPPTLADKPKELYLALRRLIHPERKEYKQDFVDFLKQVAPSYLSCKGRPFIDGGKPREKLPSPKASWLSTGIHLGGHSQNGAEPRKNALRAFASTIRNFRKRIDHDPEDPECFFVERLVEMPAKAFAEPLYEAYQAEGISLIIGKNDVLDVPVAWDLDALGCDLSNLTNPSCREYDAAFSFGIKLRRPDLTALTSLLVGRRTIFPEGLSPWEAWLKRQENDFFAGLHVLSNDDVTSRLAELANADPELRPFIFSKEIEPFANTESIYRLRELSPDHKAEPVFLYDLQVVYAQIEDRLRKETQEGTFRTMDRAGHMAIEFVKVEELLQAALTGFDVGPEGTNRLVRMNTDWKEVANFIRRLRPEWSGRARIVRNSKERFLRLMKDGWMPKNGEAKILKRHLGDPEFKKALEAARPDLDLSNIDDRGNGERLMEMLDGGWTPSTVAEKSHVTYYGRHDPLFLRALVQRHPDKVPKSFTTFSRVVLEEMGGILDMASDPDADFPETLASAIKTYSWHCSFFGTRLKALRPEWLKRAQSANSLGEEALKTK